MVSCSFHSPPGVLFTFPSRYWFTIGHSGIFSLARWSSLIHTELHVLHATRDTVSLYSFRIQDLHFLWCAIPSTSPNYFDMYVNCPTTLIKISLGVHTVSLAATKVIVIYFLFLRVLRCFNSPGLLFLVYIFNKEF